SIRFHLCADHHLCTACRKPRRHEGSSFFSSRRRHRRYWRDWSSDVCSSDLSHILNGNFSGPHRRRNIINPTACPINCTINRTARIPAIVVCKSSVTLNRNASAPNTSSDTCGKCFVGCTFANTDRKFPSSAAEYGTREYPNSTENTLASAIHSTMHVTTCAAPCPYNRSTNRLARNFESCASRQGTTPQMLDC